jgi:predicted nucleic acid-binding protein
MILDSNIIIYSAIPENTKLREYLRRNESDLTISAISRLEVLGYQKLSINEKSIFENFFQSVLILPVSNIVLNKAIEIRQQKKISIGDSIIAATALLNNQPLFTNNENDFNGLQNLQIISLKSLELS